MRSAVRWVVVVGSIVMSAWPAQAQLPALDPTSFIWTTFDFQEPDNTGVFVFDGNTQGDILAEAGRPFLLRHGATVLPLACPNQGFLEASGINSWGWVVGTCRPQGNSQAVILTEGAQGYTVAVAMALPGTQTTGLGINDWGHVVGYTFSDTDGGPHGVFAGGLGGSDGGPVVPIHITLPGQTIVGEVLTGINNDLWVSGYYTAQESTPEGSRLRTHGVVHHLSGLSFQWDAPDAIRMFLWDLNDQLRVVGLAVDTAFRSHSVLADPATAWWYIIDHPDPNVIFTDVSGIVDGDPLTFVGRLILPHPTDPNQNKVLGFRAVLKPSGFDAPPASQPGTPAASAALAAALTRQSQQGVQGALAQRGLLPTAIPLPRAPVTLNTETCDEGPGVIVPLKMRAMLGCR